nr:unnamed protein product [Callosobruchus chinensis]
MPKFLKNTKSVINIQNIGQYCFLWCIVAALNPCVRNSNKTSSYPHFSRILKYDGIPFTISLKDIPKFEKTNNLPINVFTLENTYDNFRSNFNLYTGKDCITWFVKQLQQLAIGLNSIFSHEVPMHPLTDQQKLYFYSAQICHICESSFNEEKKVRDHCHFTGQFRGAAHVSCNINYQRDHMIPVIFHNLSGFDAHFMILSLATEIPGAIDLQPVAANCENASQDFKVMRVGKSREGVNRPIKVIFQSENAVHGLVRKAKDLKDLARFKNISICYDRTPKQIDHYSKLRKQLDERTAKGESGLTIWHINGIPRIMHLN